MTTTKASLFLLLIAVFFLLIRLLLIEKTPPIWPDESIYAEIAYSDGKKIDKDEAFSKTVNDLKKCSIISNDADVEICLPIDLKYGYALYDFNRNHAVQIIKNYLERFGIYTIGRYGSWKYMSMEDVILEGRNTAEKIVTA